MENGEWKLVARYARRVITFAICLLPFSIISCQSHNGPTTRPARDPAEAALDDPFGYHPNMSNADTNISGGNINQYDKNAMKKDIDHVLNP